MSFTSLFARLLITTFNFKQSHHILLTISVFFSDPFVKVYLLVSGKRVKKKKTASCKDTDNPTWNEALSFSLSSNNIQDAALEVNIYSSAIIYLEPKSTERKM